LNLPLIPELPPNGVLLLYISADGLFPIRPQPEDTGYDLGGVLMAPKRDVEPQLPVNQKTCGQVKEHCCLYPGDLFPYTRRPTLLIVDSDNSLAFCSMPHYFDMPCVVLCSPQNVPATFQGLDINYLYYRTVFRIRILVAPHSLRSECAQMALPNFFC
jgi:hypothetical protein